MTTGLELLNAARHFDGEEYTQDPSRRCSTVSGGKDCSGLWVAAFTLRGIRGVPTVTSSQARWCHDAGGLITLDKALHTPGAVLFRGRNLGMEGYGNDGHAAGTVGDGTHVFEARGSAYGVGTFSAIGRQWDGAYHWPDIIYDGPPKPKPIPHQARRLYYIAKNPMRGDDVLNVQAKLAQWAWVIAAAGNLPASRAVNPGRIGVAYGLRCARCVAALQKLAGLKPDAIVGPATWRVLFSL